MSDEGDYTRTQRELQDEFNTTALADRMTAAIVTDHVPEAHRGFVESRDFFFLSTVSGQGEPTVSYKGGGQGVVTVRNPTTLLFPSYDGNGMFLSMGNIADTAKIGLLFIDFETPHRVRVQATATLSRQTEDLARYPGAELVVVAEVDSVFVNCARLIHPHTRVGTSKYVPDNEGNAPTPSWKQIDVMQDVLPPGTGTDSPITVETYAERLAAGES